MLIRKSYGSSERSPFGPLLTDTELEWLNSIDETKVLNDLKDDFLD